MTVPDGFNEPRFTCHVWLKAAVRALDRAGIIKCSDIDELEQTLRTFGAAQTDLTEHGKGYILVEP